MIKCPECENNISPSAKICPGCGAKLKRSVGLTGKIIAIALTLSIFSCIFKTEETKQLNAQIEANKTPEQLAQEAKINTRNFRVVIAGKKLKTSLKDPSSLQIESILSDEMANVICFTYRAKNSFGALNKEYLVFYNETASQDTKAWNKHCANKKLFDMITARSAL